MTFGIRGVSVDSVVKLINARPDFGNTPLRDAGIRNMVEKIGESLVFAVRAETLEKDSPEFAAIMKEYTDGILLYQIEQDRVWGGVAVSDSALKNYFATNREKFMFPDRVDFTDLRVVDDSVAQMLFKQARAGKTLEEIAAADSVRMSMNSSFHVEFAANSAKLSPPIIKAIAPVVGQLKADAALRVQLTAHPDTSVKRAQNLKLAEQRLATIREYFKKQGIDEVRVPVFTQPYNRNTVADKTKDKNTLGLRINADVIGRRVMVVGKPETAILPVTTDERTAKADSLQVNEVSGPFKSKYGISIIRLNKKDPLRQKTFEEAGTEVSSSFQEYESKRLEKEWLDGLRRQYPVVEYREALKSAFAPHK
jgi:peptidyl-prolyl cis-trans isomerase SurA